MRETKTSTNKTCRENKQGLTFFKAGLGVLAGQRVNRGGRQMRTLGSAGLSEETTTFDRENDHHLNSEKKKK